MKLDTEIFLEKYSNFFNLGALIILQKFKKKYKSSLSLRLESPISQNIRIFFKMDFFIF